MTTEESREMEDWEVCGPPCVVCGYAESQPQTPWKTNYHWAKDGHEFSCACGFVGDVGWHPCPLVEEDTDD